MSKQQNRTDDKQIAPGQKWQVDLFRPDDAIGVTRLFRSVYGDGYPIRAYIDPELLKSENLARRIISSVARTPCGDIVGHAALYQSAPYKKTYESGAGAVHKDYRGGHGIFTEMIHHGIEVGRKDFGIEMIYGEAVCNHVFSQKASHKIGTIPRALEIDLMPAAAYDQEKSATGRVAAMLCFKTLRPKPHTVYLPPAYAEQLQFIYANLDDARTLKSAHQTLSQAAKTKLDIEVFNFANVVRIAVLEAGADFIAVLKEKETELRKEGIKIFQIWLKLTTESVGDAVTSLRKSGYFFGGILPRWFDGDALLMQKIIGQPNWDEIKIHYDNDRKLAAMVRADWEQT